MELPVRSMNFFNSLLFIVCRDSLQKYTPAARSSIQTLPIAVHDVSSLKNRTDGVFFGLYDGTVAFINFTRPELTRTPLAIKMSDPVTAIDSIGQLVIAQSAHDCVIQKFNYQLG